MSPDLDTLIGELNQGWSAHGLPGTVDLQLTGTGPVLSARRESGRLLALVRISLPSCDTSRMGRVTEDALLAAFRQLVEQARRYGRTMREHV